MIPNKFKVAGFEIGVTLEDKLEENNYGYFPSTNYIKII